MCDTPVFFLENDTHVLCDGCGPATNSHHASCHAEGWACYDANNNFTHPVCTNFEVFDENSDNFMHVEPTFPRIAWQWYHLQSQVFEMGIDLQELWSAITVADIAVACRDSLLGKQALLLLNSDSFRVASLFKEFYGIKGPIHRGHLKLFGVDRNFCDNHKSFMKEMEDVMINLITLHNFDANATLYNLLNFTFRGQDCSVYDCVNCFLKMHFGPGEHDGMVLNILEFGNYYVIADDLDSEINIPNDDDDGVVEEQWNVVHQNMNNGEETK